MPNYKEAKKGPNGESIDVCDVTKPANNAVLRIMGTRIGFREDGQREFLVKLRGLKALEWLTNENMKRITKKLNKFKQAMSWPDWPEEEGREFMAPADPGNKKAGCLSTIVKSPTKAVKPAYPTANAGPNGEPIAKVCSVRPAIGSIQRILGTRFGFVDNGKHEYLVKVDGKDELVWLQEAHAGEFRQLIDAYKKESGEPHLRRKIGFEYFVGRSTAAPRRSERWSHNHSESCVTPHDSMADHAWSVADGINENYTPPTVENSVEKELPPRTPTEPPVDSVSTVAPQDSSVNKNRIASSNEAAASKEPHAKLDGPAGRQPDAEVRRTGESGTQAKSSTKKRLNVAVVGVEHIRVADMPDSTTGIANGVANKRAQPSGDDMDRLAQDIRNVGSKKSKMGETEQDRHIRLFHAAREAHNLDADLRIRCEKFVEFIVDESFIGHEPRDRRELFERLLDMCIQGETAEDIDCDDFSNARLLKVYGKRLRAWKAIRELFPTLLEEFKEQPEVQSPLDALTDDAFKKVNEYLSELRAAMHSMPKTLKEAVVWQLLGSVDHPYELCTEGIRKRVAEEIRKNIP